jgi:cytosine/adenosine deaminase-related metal-dependent hydrolase
MHILDWLNDVTFPNEARFQDPQYARKIYSSCVDGFLRQGITMVSYYGYVNFLLRTPSLLPEHGEIGKIRMRGFAVLVACAEAVHQ